jgi:hypothetical protein
MVRRLNWIFARSSAGNYFEYFYWVHTRPVHEVPGGASNLRSACERLVRSIPETERSVNYVRPPALFYLYQFAGARCGAPNDPSDRDGFQRWLADRAAPRFLVVDRALLADNPTLREALEAADDRLLEVAHCPYTPSRPVLLDDFGRGCLAPDFEMVIEHNYQLIVYRRQGD